MNVQHEHSSSFILKTKIMFKRFVYSFIMFLSSTVWGQNNDSIYNVICTKDESLINSKGATLEPLKIESIDAANTVQIVNYTFDFTYKRLNEKTDSKLNQSYDNRIKEELIDTGNLSKWQENNHLSVLIKQMKDGSYLVIPDLNHSGIFTDDTVYKSKGSSNEPIIIKYKINFWYKKEYTTVFDFLIYPDRRDLPPHPDKKAIFNTWGGLRYVKQGQLKVGVDSFVVKVFLNYHSIYFTKKNTRFSLSEPNENIVEIYDPHYYVYSYRDSLSLSDKILVLDTINLLGDTIKFKEVDISPELKSKLKGGIIDHIEGNSFPELKYASYNFSKANSRFTLLHFWGSWCTPCVSNLPKLKALYDVMNKQVQFIGVIYESKYDTTKAASLIKQNRMNWPQLLQLRDDPFNKAEIIRELRISGYPTYILLDNTGKIVLRTLELSDIERFLTGEGTL